MKNKTALAVLCAALGNIIWGFSFLLIKKGLPYVNDEPYVMLAHRFTLSTVFMLGMMLFGKQRISFKGKNWKPVVLLLTMQLSYYLFESYGIFYTNSTISGLVLAIVPVVTIATGALFLKEYPTKRQTLFCIMPVAGVLIISISAMTGEGLKLSNPVLGGLFLLLTLLSSAIYKTANRKAATEFSPFERTFLVLATSAIVFNVIGLNIVDWKVSDFVAPLLNVKYLLVVFFLGLLCSIAANLLVNFAMTHMSVFKVSAFGSLSTLCAAVAGIVDGEPVTKALVVGGTMILVGVRQVTKPPKAQLQEVKKDV